MSPYKNSLCTRNFFPALLLLFHIGVAHAGPDPTSTDWLPQFYSIQLEGANIHLNSSSEEFLLNSVNLDKAVSLPVNLLLEKAAKERLTIPQCTVPYEILNEYKNANSAPEILYCSDSDEIWFATSAYCGEGGDEEPDWNQGYLYSYSSTSKKVTQYKNFIPPCAALVALTRAESLLVGVTLYQSEYSQSAGEVLTLNLANRSAPSNSHFNPKSTGAVVAMSNYDSTCDCLWFSTAEGVERLTLRNGKWEQRYFDYEITPANQFIFTLSTVKPDSEKMWMGRFIYNHPISDLRGFIAAWKQATPPDYEEQTRISPMLLPHFISAAINSREWNNNWVYKGLLYLISSKQDDLSNKVATTFIEGELKRPQSLANRGELIQVANKMGIPITQGMRSAYFKDVLDNYFIRPKSNRWESETNVVKIAFSHPEYLPQLRDYYRTHIITFDVENDFLDEADSYRSWPEYAVVAEVIKEGKTRLKHRRSLLDMCGRFETPRDENALLAILQARLETDTQAKFLDDPAVGDGTERCIDASSRWLDWGGAGQFKRRVELMQAVSDVRLKPIVLEILNKRFRTGFQTIEQWKLWWAVARQQVQN